MSNELLQAQFTHLITAIKDQFPRMAYLHLVEPRTQGDGTVPNSAESCEGKSLDLLREAWGGDREGSPVLAAGGYTLKSAQETVAEHGGAVVFGRAFLANTDLPVSSINTWWIRNLSLISAVVLLLQIRLKHNLELNKPDRSTF